MADKIMTVDDYRQQNPSYTKAEFIPLTKEKEQEIFDKAKALAQRGRVFRLSRILGR